MTENRKEKENKQKVDNKIKHNKQSFSFYDKMMNYDSAPKYI